MPRCPLLSAAEHAAELCQMHGIAGATLQQQITLKISICCLLCPYTVAPHIKWSGLELWGNGGVGLLHILLQVGIDFCIHSSLLTFPLVPFISSPLTTMPQRPGVRGNRVGDAHDPEHGRDPD